VTDKGYLTLDKPFYAIEPSQNLIPDTPYIAPFWTNLVYVNQTTIRVSEEEHCLGLLFTISFVSTFS
jgi:hypothetical protein